MKRLILLLILFFLCMGNGNAQEKHISKPCKLCNAKSNKDYRHIISYNLQQIELQKNTEKALYDIGETYASGLHKTDSAIYYFNILVEKNPSFPNALSQRGLFKLFASDTIGACKDFRRAISVGDNSQVLNREPLTVFVLANCKNKE